MEVNMQAEPMVFPRRQARQHFEIYGFPWLLSLWKYGRGK